MSSSISSREAIKRQLISTKMPKYLDHPDSADALEELVEIFICSVATDAWDEANSSLTAILQTFNRVAKMSKRRDFNQAFKDKAPALTKVLG